MQQQVEPVQLQQLRDAFVAKLPDAQVAATADVLWAAAAMQQLQMRPGSTRLPLHTQSHVARAAATGVVRTSVPLNARPLLKPK